MSTTEERIAAAFAARAGGITMETSTIEKRFAEVRDRGVQERRRRRAVVVGAAALAAAAAVTAAFTFGGGLLDDDRALPPAREAPAPVPAGDVTVTGEVFPLPGTTYVVGEPFVVPFSFEVPDQGSVPGKWRIGPPEQRLAGVGLDNSRETNYANVLVAVPEQVYDPAQPKPFSAQEAMVAAPEGADGWQQWLEATGAVEVTERVELQVGGVAATRFSLDVADDLPRSGFPCVGGESCLPLGPQGPVLVGANGASQGWSELTVLDVEGQTVIAVSYGSARTVEQWLPLMRSVIDSLRFG